MATISQRITLEGSEDILKQLAALGKTGEQAFKRIQDAAKKPITDPAQIDKTKQAITELAVAGAKLGPQFQELANSAQRFGAQGEQAARQVTTGLNQTSTAAQKAGSTIQQAAEQASSAGAGMGVTLAKAAAVFTIAATGIAAAISAITSALTTGAAETATSISSQAEKLKVTIAQWLALRKAIAATKLTNDDLQGSISKITENFAKAGEGIQRLGNGITQQTIKVGDGFVTLIKFSQSLKTVQSEADKAATELGKLGITTRDIADGDVIAALRKAADAIHAMPDAAKQAQAGTAAFGDKWKEIVDALRTGAPVVDDAAKSIADFGKANRDLSEADVIKGAELTRQWEDLTLAIRATKDLIGSLFLDPALVRARWLIKLVDGSRELLRTWLGLDQLKGRAFLEGLGDSPAETTFKLLVALGEQLAGIWRDILVPAGQQLIGIVRGIAAGFGNVTGTQVAAFFIVAAVAVTGFLLALKGIAFLLVPITAFLSLFGGFGPVLLALAAAAVFFWDKLKAGASKALALIPQEVQQAKEALALLFRGDFSGFWEKFSAAAVSAFQKLRAAVLQASGVIPDLLRAITGDGTIEIPWIKTLANGIAQIGRDAPGAIEAVVGALAGLGRVATVVADRINDIFGTKLTGTDIGVILILAQMTGALQALASIAVIAGVAVGGLVRAIGLLVLGIGGLPAVILLAAAALAGIILYLDPKVWDFYADAAKRAMALIAPAIQPVLDLVRQLMGLLGGGDTASSWDKFRNAALMALEPIWGRLNALLNLIELVKRGLEFIGIKQAPGAPVPAPQQPDVIKKRTEDIKKDGEATKEVAEDIAAAERKAAEAAEQSASRRKRAAEDAAEAEKRAADGVADVFEATAARIKKAISEGWIESPGSPGFWEKMTPGGGKLKSRTPWESPMEKRLQNPEFENEIKTRQKINELRRQEEELTRAVRAIDIDRDAFNKLGNESTSRAMREAAIEAGRRQAAEMAAAAAQERAAQRAAEAAAEATRAAEEESAVRQNTLDIINQTIQKLKEEEQIPLPRPRPPGAILGDEPFLPDDRASLEPGVTNIPSHLLGSPGFNPRIPVEIDIIPEPPIEVPVDIEPKPPIEVPINIDPEGTIARLEQGLDQLDVPSSPALAAARGGLLRGRGTGTSDSNLAWLSHGEHIMPAKAVRQPGVLAFLETLRRSGGDLQRALNGMGRFALGGLVYPKRMTIPAFASGGLNGGMNNVTIQFPGLPAIGGLRASSEVVDELRKAAALAQVRSGGRKPSRYS